MSEGELLIGDGVTQGIVRIGDTVRRPLRPFSLTVQAYLAHLRDAGFTGAPLPLGVDEQGREVLSFVPGEVHRHPLPPEAAGDDVLVALARLIRALHEASAGWAPPPGAVWGGTPATTGRPVTGRAELVSHRDYATGNVVFRGGLPVALIDFDLAMPTTRLYDIANALWYWAPFKWGDPRDRAPALADRAAARGAGAVRRRHGAPLSRGFPRFGRAGPGVPQALGGRRQGRAAARRGVAARGGPGDHRSPRQLGWVGRPLA
jgi:aminoglycoside phosphotransferase (APT) family kinase protein